VTDSDRAHHRLTGRLHVDLPPHAAFTLFTARGEQRWVAGWSPRFPVGAVDDTTPGAVFETGPSDRTMIWIVVDSSPGEAIRYARILPHRSAATVDVGLRAGAGGGSDVTVTYDITSLSADADRELDDFAAGYDAFLGSWQEAIGRHLRA
jgi:hypothetical protein